MTASGNLLWDLVRTAHLAERRLTAIMADAGLTPAQFGVLSCIADGDDLSQADLAKAIMVRPQSMGRLVTDMVAAGLVERNGAGGRGRRAGLRMTPAAAAALDRARPAVMRTAQPDQLGLTGADHSSLTALLDDLRQRLQDDEAR
ncbi:MarR family transcriptional regulator [Kribbella sp. NBC_01505]|uniref:MarR family winged helix-turn-helix transcriptional regulator n=1 Tax=Kribbella sp. NBC_01505 TaxID=2903580 RepID=UPI003865598F